MHRALGLIRASCTALRSPAPCFSSRGPQGLAVPHSNTAVTAVRYPTSNEPAGCLADDPPALRGRRQDRADARDWKPGYNCFSAFSTRLVRRLTDFSAVAFERVNTAADFRRRAAEVEIVLIESGDLLQPLDIEQSEPMARQRDEVVPPEPLQDAVEVDGGQAERVGEFDLRQRHVNQHRTGTLWNSALSG